MIPNRPGRPPIDPADPSPSVNLHMRLPARLYDKSYAAARQHRLSVPEWIRQTLTQATRRQAKGRTSVG